MAQPLRRTTTILAVITALTAGMIRGVGVAQYPSLLSDCARTRRAYEGRMHTLAHAGSLLLADRLAGPLLLAHSC